MRGVRTLLPARTRSDHVPGPPFPSRHTSCLQHARVQVASQPSRPARADPTPQHVSLAFPPRRSPQWHTSDAEAQRTWTPVALDHRDHHRPATVRTTGQDGLALGPSVGHGPSSDTGRNRGRCPSGSPLHHGWRRARRNRLPDGFTSGGSRHGMDHVDDIRAAHEAEPATPVSSL
jgi:hypothetical protein